MSNIFRKLSLWFMRRKEFNRYKNILASGKYTADSRMKCFCLNEEASIEFAKKNLKISMGKGKCFNTFVIKTKKSDPSRNSILLLSNSTMDNGRPQSVKAFNLIDCEVSTYYNDEKKLEKDIRGESVGLSFLSTPKKILEDVQNKVIIDELVFSKSVDLLQNDERIRICEKVIKDYIAYYERVDRALMGEFSYSQNEEEIQRLYEAVTPIRDLPLVTVVQHGDLTFNNILYAEKQDKLFYIDFEHSRAILFYYDIFFIMQNDYIYKHNSTLLDEYLRGTFDELFSQLFQSVGLVFDPAMKKEYFILFLIAMYQMRIKTLAANNKYIALDHIKTLFHYIYKENF